MARNVDPPNDFPGDPPGTPGYTPPTGSGTAIAVMVTKPAYTVTEDQIRDAGGPWTTFTVRVTPVNDNGVGTYAEVEYTVSGSGDVVIDGQVPL